MPIWSYTRTYNYLLRCNKVRGVYPKMHMPIQGLQSIATTFNTLVPWVRPCILCLEDPDVTINSDVQELVQRDFTSTHIPLAFIDQYVDVLGDSVLDEDVFIYFLHQASLTVGILLHELAHMYKPLCHHGEHFKQAHHELLSVWNTECLKEECDDN